MHNLRNATFPILILSARGHKNDDINLYKLNKRLINFQTRNSDTVYLVRRFILVKNFFMRGLIIIIYY